jgi:protein deglycase
MAKALILFAEGFEEIEALTPVDYLRRAGIEVTMAGIGSTQITGSHGITVLVDTTVEAAGDQWDCIVVPGGKGADTIAADPKALHLIKRLFDAGALVAAICAAPARVLSKCGILEGRRFTCFPGEETKLTTGEFSEERVVVDGNLLTARAAGVSGEFSVAVVQCLLGDEAASTLADRVLLITE